MKYLQQIIHQYTRVSLVLRIFIGLAIGVALGLAAADSDGVFVLRNRQ